MKNKVITGWSGENERRSSLTVRYGLWLVSLRLSFSIPAHSRILTVTASLTRINKIISYTPRSSEGEEEARRRDTVN